MYDIAIALKGRTARQIGIAENMRHTTNEKKWKLYKQHVERENTFKNAVVLIVGIGAIVAWCLI